MEWPFSKGTMNVELFLGVEGGPEKFHDEQIRAVKKALQLGWDSVVLTITIHSLKELIPPPLPVKLSEEDNALIQRRYGLCCLSDYIPFQQFTRLNLETDSIDEVNTLIRQIPNIKYSLISVTPLNEAVYKIACTRLDIDIISIDVPAFTPRGSWKDLKAAASRGVLVEFRYSQFLKSSEMRQQLINSVNSAVFVLRGRNILMSFGTYDSALVRSPSDVVNILALLKIKRPTKLSNEIAKSVLAKGLSRQAYSGIVRKVENPPKSDESSSDDDTGFSINMGGFSII